MKKNGKNYERNVSLSDARAGGSARDLLSVGMACSRFLKSRNMMFSKRKKTGVIA